MGVPTNLPVRPANDDIFGAPSFDPLNLAHLRAWEAIWEAGLMFKRGAAEDREVDHG